MAPAHALCIPRNIAQQDTPILARGWKFPGIILVFSDIHLSDILASCPHGDASWSEARCGPAQARALTPVIRVAAAQAPGGVCPLASGGGGPLCGTSSASVSLTHNA